MQVAETIESTRALVKAARTSGKTVGFVPTMGALHAGHVSLIEAAAKDCDFIVVSIFVNPTQFGPTEDLENYPRPLEADLDICKSAGVDVVFTPRPEVMYPTENITWVTVEKLTAPLCGKSRPHHFRGVTTVCSKLFNIVLPDRTYFGQKDAQQAIVIRQMVADLNIPVEIVICPTIREANGLAISSRNKYLTEEQRAAAALIYKSLQKAEQLIDAGQTDPREIIAQIRKTLSEVPEIQIEYTDIRSAETLETVDKIAGKVLIAIAAALGPVRLIDNIVLDIRAG